MREKEGKRKKYRSVGEKDKERKGVGNRDKERERVAEVE